MTLTVHLVAGAALASKIQPAPISLILAFLSHYFLDFLFHRDYTIAYIRQRLWQKSFFDFLKVIIDIAFGVLLIFIFAENLPLALVGGVFAIIPDGLTLLFLIFPKSRILERLYNFHYKKAHFFRNKKISLIWEVFSQLAITVLAILFLAY